MIKKIAVTALSCYIFVLLSGCISGSGNKDQVFQDKVFLHEKPVLQTGSQINNHHLKNIYRYYPSKNIYYNIKNGLYFYFSDDRWVSSTSIPGILSTNIGSFITIEMDTDKPYEYHEEVRKKYPSGKIE